jgi:NAD(P)-dependent dehydrogenase (short-subunit alcohol dehydrogenase family)
VNIFITGGTSGLGLALAQQYILDGHRVGICGRDLGKLPARLTEHALFSSYKADVVDKEGLFDAMERFSGDIGLDLVIANAGRSVGTKPSIPDFELGREVMRVNVIGVMNTFEKAMEIMLPKKSGHMVAISSVAGLVGLPRAGAYCASKAAVIKLCESMSVDLAVHGINVSAILPGFIDTPLTEINAHPMPFLMSAEKAAKITAKAIEDKKVYFIFPRPMKFLILLLEKMPRFLYRWIIKRMH